MRKLGTLLVSGAMLAAMVSPASAFLASPGRQIYEELPDPNVPLAPEVVTVQNGDTQTAYVRMENPDDRRGGGYVYVPEDEVPRRAEDDEARRTTAVERPGVEETMDDTVSIGEEEIPLAAADDDGSSADGFGGPGASIDISPGADAGMSTDKTSFPIVPVAGAAAGTGCAWWLIFIAKGFEIEEIGGAVKKVSLFRKVLFMLRHKK